MSEPRRVTIAGGGIAGLTAALRLAERGYKVKVYEQKSMLGGDLASRATVGGTPLDVYPHMYLSWYHNFWRLLDDVTGADRNDLFRAVSSVKYLRPGEFPRFKGVTDMYSVSRIVRNVLSGVGPPADMFLFGYASIDLLAEKLNPTMLLDDVSVTGFLHARPYMTERTADAFNNFIMTVWGIPSYLASAEDYRAYLAYSFADHHPAYWLAKGSAVGQVIEPLIAALQSHGAEIVTKVQVAGVTCTDGRVTEIALEKTEFDERGYQWVGAPYGWSETVDELVLAVSPDALSWLIRTGPSGRCIVDAEPRLAEVSRLRMEPIPTLHLYFTRKLRDIPPEPVGLCDSRFALAFTDISQTWHGVADFEHKTVLSLSASDPYALPNTDFHDNGMAMLRDLAQYLHFEPGRAWGESPDIDWNSTRFEPNSDSQLFVNETGTDVWRPPARCESVGNLSFAGDFCANRIGMTTIESAVTTGLEAARAIVQRRGGRPVQIAEPDAGIDALYVWLRYAWAPYAAAAKTWSMGTDCVRSLRHLLTPSGR
jgi:Flavin containing amine oxidoreductase